VITGSVGTEFQACLFDLITEPAAGGEMGGAECWTVNAAIACRTYLRQFVKSGQHTL
jgi:hypothetical protein